MTARELVKLILKECTDLDKEIDVYYGAKKDTVEERLNSADGIWIYDDFFTIADIEITNFGNSYYLKLYESDE